MDVSAPAPAPASESGTRAPPDPEESAMDVSAPGVGVGVGDTGVSRPGGAGDGRVGSGVGVGDTGTARGESGVGVGGRGVPRRRLLVLRHVYVRVVIRHLDFQRGVEPFLDGGLDLLDHAPDGGENARLSGRLRVGRSIDGCLLDRGAGRRGAGAGDMGTARGESGVGVGGRGASRRRFLVPRRVCVRVVMRRLDLRRGVDPFLAGGLDLLDHAPDGGEDARRTGRLRVGRSIDGCLLDRGFGRRGAACGESGVGVGDTGAACGESGVGVGDTGAARGESGVGVGNTGAACGESGVGVGNTGTACGESGVGGRQLG